ncbi:MAG: hypothetical protein LAP13_12020 [Acidobacteriia bacterium]|nr:hypothetical protein [Terriglobia bacterium]
MRKCDLCHVEIEYGEGYSPEQVRTAVGDGLRPRGLLEELIVASGRSIDRDWVELTLSTPTYWMLCIPCARDMETYLHPRSTRMFYGATVEEAKGAAVSEGIPAESGLVEVQPATEEVVYGYGQDAEGAMISARGKISPDRPFDIGKQEITREGQTGQCEIEGYSFEGACKAWESRAPKFAELYNHSCLVEPKTNFLGTKRTPGRWKIDWRVTFEAKVSYKLPARMTVRYTEPAVTDKVQVATPFDHATEVSAPKPEPRQASVGRDRESERPRQGRSSENPPRD